MSSVNCVNWFELYVQDMARARAFYERVLGIALEPLKLPTSGLLSASVTTPRNSWAATFDARPSRGRNKSDFFICDSCCET